MKARSSSSSGTPGATKRYASPVRTISQRELRNDNAAIIRGIESGESYTVTKRGVPVARLIPYEDASSLRCVRSAQRRLRFSDLARVTAQTPTQAILDEIRGER